MIVDWERGLFWLWLAGAIGWIVAITFYVYGETSGFELHMSANEWISFTLLWFLPPILTFAVYLFVLWIGRKMSSRSSRWERQQNQLDNKQFRRRG